jgi:transketolase
VLERVTPLVADDLRRGGYLLHRGEGGDPVTLIATGSEVWLALEAARRLEADGHATRVVSAPAPQLLLAREHDEVLALLGPRHRRVTIEAGATDYWRRVTGDEGLAIGIDHFGESAPYAALQEHFGFTPEKVAARIASWIG